MYVLDVTPQLVLFRYDRERSIQALAQVRTSPGVIRYATPNAVLDRLVALLPGHIR